MFPECTTLVDICDVEALTDALRGCREIYHLAAEHRDDVRPAERYYAVNGGGTTNVARAASALAIGSIVFTSTVALYGLGQGESSEASPPCPFNDYGNSKLQAEGTLRQWAASDTDRRLVIVRLAATFGPGGGGNLRRMVEEIRHRRFIAVGTGGNRKSVAYVGNVAAFLEYSRLLEQGVTVVNYADKPDLTTGELVKVIRRGLGRSGSGLRVPAALGVAGGFTLTLLKTGNLSKALVMVDRVRKFSANTIIKTEKLCSLNFRAPYSLEQGLLETVDRSDVAVGGGAPLSARGTHGEGTMARGT